MQGSQLHKINNTEAAGHQGPAGLHLEPVTKRERSPSPSECCSPDTLNPPSPADSSKWRAIFPPVHYYFLAVRDVEILRCVSHAIPRKAIKTAHDRMDNARSINCKIKKKTDNLYTRIKKTATRDRRSSGLLELFCVKLHVYVYVYVVPVYDRNDIDKVIEAVQFIKRKRGKERGTLSQNLHRDNVELVEYIQTNVDIVDCSPSAQQIPRTRHEYNMACLL